MCLFLFKNDVTDKNMLCESENHCISATPTSNCLDKISSSVLCSVGSVMDDCTDYGGTGCCYDLANEHDTTLLSYCESTSQNDNHKVTRSFSTTLSHSIAPLSTESTAPISSNNFLPSTGETYAIQTSTTATFLSNNLTTEVTAIQTTTQSTQNTTHINNLTIITISLGVILLLIVLTLVLICVILSVVIIVKRHRQFQPGKCHINNNN